MPTELTNRDRLFQATIRRALQEWDPLGVTDEAEDEYDAYVPTIYQMLITRKPRHEIVNYLLWLVVVQLQSSSDPQVIEKLADRLMRIEQELG
jgi:hypothetical protein